MNLSGQRHQHFVLLPLLLSVRSSFCFTGTMNQTNATCSEKYDLTAYRIALIIIYTLVLMAGSAGLTLMIGVLKSNLRSWTIITFFNLILVHFLFLITVPFRIYYYVTDCWTLTLIFCKVVSSMIHIHMHVVFVIYIIILTINFVHYFKKIEQMEFYRSIHAMVFSIAIWSILLIAGPVVLYHYGNHASDDKKCFHFDLELKEKTVNGCNIFLSVSTIIVSFIVSCILAFIFYMITKKHGAFSRHQQDFWAQIKNVSLVLIILLCLAPYHVYRLYYLRQLSMSESNHESTDLRMVNEVFLAISSLSCSDMILVFAGKGICHRCGG